MLFPCVLDDSFFLRDGVLKVSGTFLMQQRFRSVDVTLGQSPHVIQARTITWAEPRLLTVAVRHMFARRFSTCKDATRKAAHAKSQ
jgi:hypothetical protein